MSYLKREGLVCQREQSNWPGDLWGFRPPGSLWASMNYGAQKELVTHSKIMLEDLQRGNFAD